MGQCKGTRSAYISIQTLLSSSVVLRLFAFISTTPLLARTSKCIDMKILHGTLVTHHPAPRTLPRSNQSRRFKEGKAVGQLLVRYLYPVCQDDCALTTCLADATLSPDNRWMIYSSITPYVYLVPTGHGAEAESEVTTHSEQQVMLDFSNQGSDDAGVRWRSGVRPGVVPWHE